VLRRGSFVADVSFSKPTVAAAKVIGSPSTTKNTPAPASEVAA